MAKMPSFGTARSTGAPSALRSSATAEIALDDHVSLALLEQIEGLRHLRVDGEQVGLQRHQLLEGGIDVLLRLGHRLAGREDAPP